MRQFNHVSFSPWASPYSTGPTAGQNVYGAPTNSQQPQRPVYRRLVFPPAPIYYQPSAEQAVGEESDGDGTEEDPSGIQVDNPVVEAPEPPPATAPETPSAPEQPSETTPKSAPADQPTSPDPSADAAPAPSTDEVATQPEPQEPASSCGEDTAGGETKPDDVKDEPPGDDGGQVVAKETESPAPPVTEVPTLAVDELKSLEDATVKRDPPSAESSSPAPPPEASEPAPPVPEEVVASSEPEQAAPAPIDTSKEPCDKSGEPEPAAQAPPKSPSTKSVHFSPDVKDPAAAGIESKKVGIVNKIGKGKATGFVRIRELPVPVRPSSPKLEKKPAKDDKKKTGKDSKKEAASSAYKEKEIAEKEAPPPAFSKRRLSKAEERKKRKHDDKEKKPKRKKSRKGSDASRPEDDSAEEDGKAEAQGSSVADAAPSAEVIPPPPEKQDELTAKPATVEQPEDSLSATEQSAQIENPPKEDVEPVPQAPPTDDHVPNDNSPAEDDPATADNAAGEDLGPVIGEIAAADENTQADGSSSLNENPVEESIPPPEDEPTMEDSPAAEGAAEAGQSVTSEDPREDDTAGNLPSDKPADESLPVKQPSEEAQVEESPPQDSAPVDQSHEEAPGEANTSGEGQADAQPAKEELVLEEGEGVGATSPSGDVQLEDVDGKPPAQAQSAPEDQEPATDGGQEQTHGPNDEATPDLPSEAITINEPNSNEAHDDAGAPELAATVAAPGETPDEPCAEGSDEEDDEDEEDEELGEKAPQDSPGQPEEDSVHENPTEASEDVTPVATTENAESQLPDFKKENAEEPGEAGATPSGPSDTPDEPLTKASTEDEEVPQDLPSQPEEEPMHEVPINASSALEPWDVAPIAVAEGTEPQLPRSVEENTEEPGEGEAIPSAPSDKLDKPLAETSSKNDEDAPQDLPDQPEESVQEIPIDAPQEMETGDAALPAVVENTVPQLPSSVEENTEEPGEAFENEPVVERDIPDGAVPIEEPLPAVSEPAQEEESVEEAHLEAEASNSQNGEENVSNDEEATSVADPIVVEEPSDGNGPTTEGETSDVHKPPAVDEAPTNTETVETSESPEQIEVSMHDDKAAEPLVESEAPPDGEVSANQETLVNDTPATASESMGEADPLMDVGESKVPSASNVAEEPVPAEETVPAVVAEEAVSAEGEVPANKPVDVNEPAVQDDATTESETVVDSTPNPADVAIVEKIMMAHSSTSSAGSEGEGLDPVASIPETTATEPRDYESVADTDHSFDWDAESIASTHPVSKTNEADDDIASVDGDDESVADTDHSFNWDEESSVDPDPAEDLQETEDGSAENIIRTSNRTSNENHQYSPPDTIESNNPNDSINDSNSEAPAQGDASAALEASEAMTAEQLTEKKSTDQETDMGGSNSTPCETEDALVAGDIDTVADASISNLNTKEESTENASDTPPSDEAPDSSQSELSKEANEPTSNDQPAETVHEESTTPTEEEGVAQESHANEDPEEDPELGPNPAASSEDAKINEHDDPGEHDTPNEEAMADTECAEPGLDTEVGDAHSSATPEIDVEKSTIKSEEPRGLKETVVSVIDLDEGLNEDDPPEASPEGDSAISLEVQVPSDAASKDSPTQEADSGEGAEQTGVAPETVSGSSASEGMEQNLDSDIESDNCSDTETGLQLDATEPAMFQHDSAEAAPSEGIDDSAEMESQAEPKNATLHDDQTGSEELNSQPEVPESESTDAVASPDSEGNSVVSVAPQIPNEGPNLEDVVENNGDVTASLIVEDVETSGVDSVVPEPTVEESVVAEASEEVPAEQVPQESVPAPSEQAGTAVEVNDSDGPSELETEPVPQQDTSEQVQKELTSFDEDLPSTDPNEATEQESVAARLSVEPPAQEPEAEGDSQVSTQEKPSELADVADTREPHGDRPLETLASQDDVATEQKDTGSEDAQPNDPESQEGGVQDGMPVEPKLGSADILADGIIHEPLPTATETGSAEVIEELPVEASPQAEDTHAPDEIPVDLEHHEVEEKDQVTTSEPLAEAEPESSEQLHKDVQDGFEDPLQPSATEEMEEVHPITPPTEPEEQPIPIATQDREASEQTQVEATTVYDITEKATEPEGITENVVEAVVEHEPAVEPEPPAALTAAALVEDAHAERVHELMVEPASAVAEPNPELVLVEQLVGQLDANPIEQEELESSRAAALPPAEDMGELSDPFQDPQPQTPPNERAVVNEPTPESMPIDKPRRRHSHRDSRHSHRRRESNASTNERPMLNPMALIAAAKMIGSSKSKRRDSATDREHGRHKERLRNHEKESNSSKERSYREHRSHRHHRDRGDEKDSKRRTLEEVEAEAERRQRREARRAEKERIAQEEAARLDQEEEERRQRRREERRAQRAEAEKARIEQEEKMAREAEEKLAREEEERRIRHERRRQKYEARKEAERLEREKVEQEEEERRLRRQRRAERARERLPTEAVDTEPRDAARRAAEEEDEPVEASPVVPRAERRHKDDRRRETPPARRNSLLGGRFSLFGRHKPEAVVSKPMKPVVRVRDDPAEAPPSPVDPLRKEVEDQASSQHSSNESRDRTHRSRRHSTRHRRFDSAQEEAEYRAWKEERRRPKTHEPEMTTARDGGVSIHAAYEDAPPVRSIEVEVAPEPQPEVEERPPSPLFDDVVPTIEIPSTSSGERRDRRDRRRTRRVSIVESERMKYRQTADGDRERPTSQRKDTERPRTRGGGGGEERTRPRRSETERHTRSSKKKDDSGFKGFFGGLKRRVA